MNIRDLPAGSGIKKMCSNDLVTGCWNLKFSCKTVTATVKTEDYMELFWCGTTFFTGVKENL